MNQHLMWYVARASGLTASALLALSVIWGLLLTTRILGGRPRPAWILDLHRFLGAGALAFVGLHLVGLVGDNFVHFGAAELFVPFVSPWQPGAVAWGIVAFYLLVVVEVTSLLMKRMSRRVWHGIHLSSYVLFWVAAVHAATAGTDTGNTIYVWVANATIATVLVLTLFRLIAEKRKTKRPRARDLVRS